MPRLSRRLRLLHALSRLLGAEQGRVEGRYLVVEACPLCLAHELRLHLPDRRQPVLLVTTDLDDPLPRLRERDRTLRRWAAHIRWRSALDFAGDPEVAELLSGARFRLPREEALASPRLSPALELLLPALGRVRERPDGWTVRERGKLLAAVAGVHTGLAEVVELRLTEAGRARWPGLSEGLELQPARAPYALRLDLPPELVGPRVEALRAQRE